MDAAEPPRIVWEGGSVCADQARSEALLRLGVGSARAPSSAWVVSLRLEAAEGNALRAKGAIVDGRGIAIAHRTLSATFGDCDGVAQAVGLWASLVLDSELARARAAQGTADPAPPLSLAEAKGQAAWPAPAPLEKPSPEHDWYLHHDDVKTLEFGLGAFLGTGSGPSVSAFAGATPFVVAEAGHGVFLRPSLGLGQSVSSLATSEDVRATLLLARFDTCLRMPGLYTKHRGIQLDPCGGVEGGLTNIGVAQPVVVGSPHSAVAGVPSADTTLPFVSVGPSLELRGELGSAWSVGLRGIGGINVLRPGFVDATGVHVDPPWWSARIELALSWSLR